jgi:broad specificity phosphatase PhoE
MLTLILVRHGETERNSQGKLQGGMSDLPLNEKGREQGHRLGMALQGEKLEAIYSSPLRRALATAEAISAHHHLKALMVPALTELNMGLIDGLDLAQVKENHAGFLWQWREGNYSVALPEGESVLEVQQRAWGAVEDTHRHHPEGTVVLVSHSITLQMIITAALEAPLASFQRFRIAVGSISILHIDDHGSSLVRLNDVHHLGVTESPRFS